MVQQPIHKSKSQYNVFSNYRIRQQINYDEPQYLEAVKVKREV